MRTRLRTTITRSFMNRAAAIVSAVALLAGGATPLYARPASAVAVPQNVAKISFTFDDGLQSAFTNAQPTLAKYGLTGTDYVITGCVGMTTAPNTCAADNNGTYMTWDQIKQLQAAGWEIGSHTVDHGCMASDSTIDPDDCTNASPLTAAQLETELAGSQQALAAQGIAATDFAWPYGDYGNLSLSVAAKYYATTRGFADDDANNVYPYNDLVLHDQQFQEGGAATRTWAICQDMTVLGAESCIDNAVAAGQWIVLVFHNITSGDATLLNTSQQTYDESQSSLDQIAAYAASKQTAGQAKVVNINEGIATGANLLPNGDFAAGITGGWTTDDPTDITADANGNGRYPEPTHSVLLKGNPSGADNHLYSPKVAVTAGQTYVIKNYVNITSGTSVNFYIDEYDANGVKLAGQDPKAGVAYVDCAVTTKCIDVADVNFNYTPSAGAAYASLQVIVKGATTQAYYDGAQLFIPGNTSTTTGTGDINGDGKVDALDLSTLLTNWNKTSATAAQGDLNGDGTVDALDLSTLLTNWSK
jgi:peptidoglycan/xylan/chitin deacetylase (PgdA/CDA1 family)